MKTYSIFITKAATSRIFDVPPKDVVKVQEWATVVWVHIVGCRPQFVSKKRYISDAITTRKANAEQVTLQMVGDQLWETSKGYLVSVNANGASCSCKDFENQQQAFGRGCCKHAYAVLNQLGFSSLGAYMQG